VIQIGEAMLTQGDQQLATFSFKEERLFLGLARSNQQLLFLLLKRSTWHALVQLKKLCGLEGSYMKWDRCRKMQLLYSATVEETWLC
jgi:hypothetical protein